MIFLKNERVIREDLWRMDSLHMTCWTNTHTVNIYDLYLQRLISGSATVTLNSEKHCWNYVSAVHAGRADCWNEKWSGMCGEKKEKSRSEDRERGDVGTETLMGVFACFRSESPSHSGQSPPVFQWLVVFIHLVPTLHSKCHSCIIRRENMRLRCPIQRWPPLGQLVLLTGPSNVVINVGNTVILHHCRLVVSLFPLGSLSSLSVWPQNNNSTVLLRHALLLRDPGITKDDGVTQQLTNRLTC